ncbi:hypothetical protein HHI36_018613 [Cryptolaemus montrouzieri]|uniref:Uncharacterized protein n=1 Tax=Cryptolaemus montrouzieri TaxID=559131 RepID=A0ABD2P0F8_9CUCU
MIFSPCPSGNPTVLHLTRIKNVNYNVSPIPSNESDNDEDVDPNFSIPSHQSLRRSFVRSENESLEQSEVEIEGIEEEEAEKKGKERKANPGKWIAKKAKFLRNSGKTYVSSSKTKKSIAARKL